MTPPPDSAARPCLHAIDGTALVHRFWFASGARGRDGALAGLATWLTGYLERHRPALLACVFDPAGPTFRHERDPTYKHSRGALEPDLAWQRERAPDVVEALGCAAFRVAGFEADDLIATLCHRGERAGLQIAVVSPDKDVLQLLGAHVRQVDPKTFAVTTAEDVTARQGVPPERLADVMALAGDKSDDVVGVPGIGMQTAANLIAEFGSLEAVLAEPSRVAASSLRGARRVAGLLEAHRDAALLARYLVSLRRDVPLPDLVLGDLRWKGWRPEKAAALAAVIPRGLRGRLEKLEDPGNAPQRPGS
jgi:DNA polymerase-1